MPNMCRNLKKKEKIDDYNKHTKTDAERKRKAYVAIDHMTEENKIENRKRWAEKKRKQRAKNKSITSEQPTKIPRYVNLTGEEKKLYFKTKMQKYRAQQSRQKQVAIRHKDRSRKTLHTPSLHTPTSHDNSIISSSTSRATYFRSKQRVKNNMPSSPSAYAKVIDSLVSESVTPKNKLHSPS